MYKIAAVEDDALMQRLLRDIMKPEGYEFMLCPDGKTALEKVPVEKPDLVILDVNLPDLNGFEVCRGLKADPRTKHIPILMLTGESRETVSPVVGLDLGADDYLFKPIGAKVLLSRIQSILRLATKPTK